MTVTTSRRGRPKGTGIDDRAILIEIAEMIAADPAKKPTTAIRALGIEDPSIIRRLRDKYNERTKTPAETAIVPSRTRIRAANDDERSSTICLERMRDTRLKRSPPIPLQSVAAFDPPPTTPTRAIDRETAPSLPEPVTAEPETVSTLATTDRPIEPTPLAPSIDISAEDASRALANLLSSSMRASASTVKAQIMLGTQLMHSPPVIAAMRFQLAWTAFFIAFCRPQSAETAI